MKRPLKFSLLLVVWMSAAGFAADRNPRKNQDPPDPAEIGRQLFVRRFVAGQKQPEGGDGLGPVFNHVSCAACHRQGALGGGGEIEFNVSLLSAQLESPSNRPDDRLILITLKGLHPAFVTTNKQIVPNILLHRFGAGERYFQFKTSLGGQEIPIWPSDIERAELQRELARDPLPVAKSRGHIQLIRPQRNTTALFGAGLIDQIPDSVLHDLAAAQAKRGDISGRVPPIGPDKVGRFGWRGQQEHLHDFVLGACANELGLEVPGNSQPIDPLRPTYRPRGLDLTDTQCRQMTTYIASLPPPRFTEPMDTVWREMVDRGRALFSSVGCIRCHVEQVGGVDGIYSDLLLHDLGPNLVDPVLAASTLIFVRQLPKTGDSDLANVSLSIPRNALPDPPPQPAPPGTYYGGPTFSNLALGGRPPTTVTITDPSTRIQSEYRLQQTLLDREWRTPPLWGVADSPPYLHDGRAATLEEAITLHGGEADASAKQFASLPPESRLALIEFLNCLKAP